MAGKLQTEFGKDVIIVHHAGNEGEFNEYLRQYGKTPGSYSDNAVVHLPGVVIVRKYDHWLNHPDVKSL